MGPQREEGMFRFDHHRLDAFAVAREVLQRGDAIAKRLPRGYGALGDQLRRALLSTFLGIAEGSSRTGTDRVARFRCARGEASEAAAALEAVALLGLAAVAEVEEILALLDRLCAMLTRLAGLAIKRPPTNTDSLHAHAPPEPPSNTNTNSNTDSDTDSNTPAPSPIPPR
jgi:four helix bundle protein